MIYSNKVTEEAQFGFYWESFWNYSGKIKNIQQSEIYSDESWRYETKCPIPEIEHDPKAYCPEEWPCHLKTKYCNVVYCEFGASTTTISSVAIFAILGCVLLAIVLVLVFLFFYRIRRKTRDQEKTSRRKNLKRSETSKSTKPLLNETIQEQPFDTDV